MDGKESTSDKKSMGGKGSRFLVSRRKKKRVTD